VKNPVLIDIETDGQPAHGGRLLLVGWCLLGEPANVIDWVSPMGTNGPTPEGVEAYRSAGELQGYLADPERPVISMTKYDPRYLTIQGWDVAGPYYDIQVMAWVLNENQPLSLDKLAKRYCGLTMDKRLRRSAGTVIFQTDSGAEVPLTEMGPDQESWTSFVEYCRRDVAAEAELFQTLWERLEDSTWLEYFLAEEVPLTEVLLGMETAGMPVNVEASEELRLRLEQRAGWLEASLHLTGELPAPFNLNSGPQLAKYLFNDPPVVTLEDRIDLGPYQAECIKSCLADEHEDCEPEEGGLGHAVDWLPEGFTAQRAGRTQIQGVWTFKGRGLRGSEWLETAGRWSTATPVLKSNLGAVRDPWCLSLMEYRKVEKMLTTYLRPMPFRTYSPEGETYAQAVQRVRGEFRPEVPPRPTPASEVRDDDDVQSAVRSTSGTQGQLDGTGHHQLRLPDSASTREARSAVGAPGRDGAAGGATSSVGGSAPPQRGQVGQPGGELGAAAGPELPPFRAYCRFNQTGTKTGRLSSSDFNLQNQPAHGELGEAMRGLFQGRLVVGDYSQLEPRLAAHFSEDPRLLSVYREARDAYVDLAEGIFGHSVEKHDPERGVAKVLLLAMNYGAYEKKVAQILTINGFPTEVDRAREYLEEMQRYYRRFFAWREAVIARVKVRGYVQTIGGRHRRLKAAFADRKNWKNVGYGERQAVNAIIQGSAGDIVRRVMVNGNWQHEQRLLAQVHDELVWEWDGVADPAPGQLAHIGDVGATQHGFGLNVPLVFEPHFGHSWYAAKEGVVEELDDQSSIDFEEE
jgi:DNA polymerase I-like protein with 3'-5' exonuclease and polymerase domains